MGSKTGPDISGGEKKNLPSERVTSNSSYARRLYVKRKGRNSATRRYPPDCTNALVPTESTCGLPQLCSFLAAEGSRIKPRTYTFLPRCRYCSKTNPERQSVQNSRWQLNCATHVLYPSNGHKQNKQPWNLNYWRIYSSFGSTACYPADR